MISILRKIYENVMVDRSIDDVYFQYVEERNIDGLNKLIKTQMKRNGFSGTYWSGSLGDRGSVYQRAEQNGIWTSPDEDTAVEYSKFGGNVSGKIRAMAIKTENPLDLRQLGVQNRPEIIKRFLEKRGVKLTEDYYQAFQNEMQQEEQDTWFVYSIIDGWNWKNDRKLAISIIEQAGYDSIIISDTHYQTQSDSYVLFHSEQVKLLNLVTQGDDGKIIPISERFSDKPDIRY